MTCLTIFQLNYGSKEVAGTYIYSSILCTKIIHFLLLCDPTYMNTVRVNCGHGVLSLSIRGTDALGITAGSIFKLCFRAGWIRLYRLAGMGMNEIG